MSAMESTHWDRRVLLGQTRTGSNKTITSNQAASFNHFANA
jgi:hypothetical protein